MKVETGMKVLVRCRHTSRQPGQNGVVGQCVRSFVCSFVHEAGGQVGRHAVK